MSSSLKTKQVRPFFWRHFFQKWQNTGAKKHFYGKKSKKNFFIILLQDNNGIYAWLQIR
jgi:hypothetical protein